MSRVSRDLSMYPIIARQLEVQKIVDITPGMRRIVFGGAKLGEHQDRGHTIPAMHSLGFDDDVRLIFPDPATGELPEPTLSEHGTVIWDVRTKELFRTYTVRWLNHETGEVAIDFARHGVGLAENWSQQADVGDMLWVVGPKGCLSLPTHKGWLLLVGDETALPAIARGLEELPSGFPVTAIIEVAESEHIYELHTAADAQILWAVRAQGESFIDLMNTFQPSTDIGTGFVWVAGEASKLKQARAIVKQWQIAKEDTEFTGYWRDNPVQVAEDGTIAGGGYSVLEQAHELTELSIGFVLRAAVRLGMLTAIADGCNSVAKLSAAIDVDQAHLCRVLAFLHQHDVIEQTEETITLRPIGREFADEESHMVAELLHPMDKRLFTLMELENTLRTGGVTPIDKDSLTPRSGGNSTTTWQAELHNPTVGAYVDQHVSFFMQFVAPPAIASIAPKLPATPQILIQGTGVTGVVTQIRKSIPAAVISAQANPANNSGIFVDPGFAYAEADLPAALAQFYTDSGGNGFYILTPLVDADEADEHVAEEDLVRMTSTGGHVPTKTSIATAITTAGLQQTALQPVGLGIVLIAVSD